MSRPPRYSELSLWHATADEDWTPRPSLGGDLDVDVAVVGAGFTGLWTAYYLAGLDPSLRIAVLEREVAGFGASGRNGGWCSAHFSASAERVARLGGRAGALGLARALQDSVDEVGRVADVAGIDAHYAKGGIVELARSPAQLARARDEVAETHGIGLDEADLRLLGADEARAICAATGVLGGTYTPHGAALHPARLVRGLARAVERQGVRVYEGTAVAEIVPRSGRVEQSGTGEQSGAGGQRRPEVVTAHGTVRADAVVRATEGYTAGLPGQRRTLAPVYSLMLATEPLPSSFWDSVGLRHRETFDDMRHLVIYGQRTADDRLAFGGRGAPYHYGSRVRPEYDREPRVYAGLRRVLVDLFPEIADAAVTHTWGGPIGVPRDWLAAVGFDRKAGIGWAGGYVGAGVGASNLAGRTLADLVLGRDTDRVRLPWVGHRWPRWEPEPLRWLGVNAGLALARSTDSAETRRGRQPRRAALLTRLTGG